MDADEFDALFESPLSVRQPHIPGEVQQFGWLILAKRCRQLLASRRVFFFEQFFYLLLSICMTNPHASGGTTWGNFSETVNVIVLGLSACELVLYAAGHGILPQTGAAGASNWKVMSVLFVWSPLRLRPRMTSSSGDVGSSFTDATPLLSNHVRTMELLVVLLSIIGYIVPGSDTGYSRMRYLHGLRCLRLVTSLMHMIPVTEYFARTFQDGIVLMVPAGIFLAFFFVLFGVAATDQLRGTFRSRCVTVLPRILLELDTSKISSFNYSDSCFGWNRPILDNCTEVIPIVYCADQAKSDFFNPNVCTPPAVCRILDNPYNGYSSFDNIFASWMTMIRVSSLSNWNEVLYGAWGSQPQPIVGALFVLFIIISSFVVLNFIVAILSSTYNRAKSMQVTNQTEKFLAKAMENLRIGELLWWNFPSQVRHHLTVRIPASSEGDGSAVGTFNRGGAISLSQPFFLDYRYVAARDIWLLGLVVAYSFNGSGVSSAFLQFLTILENANLVIFTVDIFFSLLAAGSFGLFASRKVQQFDSFAYFLTVVGFNIGLPLSVTRCLLLVHNIQRLQFVRKRNLIRNSHAAGFPAMAVIIFLSLFLFVAAGVAVQIFSHNDIPVNDGNYPDPLAFGVNSFDSFALALTNMIRFVTADSWELIVFQAMDDQSIFLGLVFFLPAYILFTYMFHALFSAVVIAAFEPSTEDKIGWQRKAEELEDVPEDGQETLDDGDQSVMMASNSPLGNSFAGSSSKFSSSVRMGPNNAAQAINRGSADDATAAVDSYRQSVPDRSLAIFGVHNKLRMLAVRLVVDASENDELRVIAERRLKNAERQRAASSSGNLAASTYGIGSPLTKRRTTGGNETFAASVNSSNSGDGGSKGTRSAISLVGGKTSFHSPLSPNSGNNNNSNAPSSPLLMIEEPPKTYGNIFQLVVMVFVLGSCLSILFDPAKEACSLLDAGQNSRNPFNYIELEVMFAAVFTFEMVLKIIAHGLLFPGDDRPWYLGPTYFRDVWNVADFLLLLVMYISFFYPTVAALRLMRILRPLRVIRRVGNMKLMVRGLFLSLPTIGVVVLLSVFFLLVYAIIGVALFKDLMYYCTTNDLGGKPVLSKGDCQGLYFNEYGVLTSAVWTRYDSNFDDVPAALSYLVQIASMSHWTRLVDQVISINGLDMQPVALQRVQNVFFFFSYILIVQCFVLNIVIGVILAILDELRGILFLTVSQRDWQSLRKVILKMKPLPPQPISIFPKLQKVVLTAKFEHVVNVAVFVNIIFVSSVHYNQTKEWDLAQFYANTLFTFFFLLEMVAKVISLRLQYLLDPWNRIDMLVVIGSLFEFVFEYATSSQSLTLTSIARGLRVLRVFRSVKRVPVLRSLFLTLMESLAAICSLVGVIVLIVTMYALVGMALFGNVKFLSHLSRDANFRSINAAWFTVFRMLTLDGWNAIMDDLSTYSGSFCTSSGDGLWYLDSNGHPSACGTFNDCSSPLAQVYFFSFYVVGVYLLLNVVIAILLHNFRVLSAHARSPVQSHDLEMFQREWRKILRSEGIECNSANSLAEEHIPRFIRRLFTKGNRLVYHPTNATVHIHPYMTARSRANYAQFLEELLELELASTEAKQKADAEAERLAQQRAAVAAAKAAQARKKQEEKEKAENERRLKKEIGGRRPTGREVDVASPPLLEFRRRPQILSHRELLAIQTANTTQFAQPNSHHHHHHHHHDTDHEHTHYGHQEQKEHVENSPSEPGTPLRPEGPPTGPTAFTKEQAEIDAAAAASMSNSNSSPVQENVPNPQALDKSPSDAAACPPPPAEATTRTFLFTNILLALCRLQVGPEALTLTQQRHRHSVRFAKCCSRLRSQLLRALGRARQRLEVKRLETDEFFSPGQSTNGDGGSGGTPQVAVGGLQQGGIPSFRSVVSWVEPPNESFSSPQQSTTLADIAAVAAAGENDSTRAADLTRQSSGVSAPFEADQTGVFAPNTALYSSSYPTSFRGMPAEAAGRESNRTGWGGGGPSLEAYQQQPSMSAFLGSFSTSAVGGDGGASSLRNSWALTGLREEEASARRDVEETLWASLMALLTQATTQRTQAMMRRTQQQEQEQTKRRMMTSAAAPRVTTPRDSSNGSGLSLRRGRMDGAAAASASGSSTPTWPGRNPVLSIATPSQMCPIDQLCPQYRNLGHCSLRRHTCRDGPRCVDASAEHRRLYAHVASFDSDEIEEVFIDFTS